MSSRLFRLSAVAMALSLSACQLFSSTTHDSAHSSSSTLALPSGVTLVEQQLQANGENIPFQKFKLANGLTVILHEDRSDPLVHVDVTYHVGSAREELGKSGFAHFFEHMMFQGSEHVADEQHFKIITEAGGDMNGSTNSDRTNYYQTVPMNQLEKVLWLESDRMGFLLGAVTEKKFENQRETVKNERGQRVDNQPYGRLEERMAQALYPADHPYAWPVIGYMDDLNRANVNDVKAFFLRWYGPNNATITIGGDINAAETLALVQKYFGEIPQGPAVEPASKQRVTLDKNRYISMQDNVHLPLLAITYPTVYARHADEAPLDVLSQILGGGNNSLLYKNLVKNQLAVQVQSSHSCRELACEFSLYALPHPASGKTLADIEAIVRASFNEFEQRGVLEDDLNRVKAQMEAGTIYGLQSVSGKVSSLAFNETFYGQPDLSAAELARYRNVTKEDVLRVYHTYIRQKPAVIMSVVPKGQTQLVAHADTFTPPKRADFATSSTKASDLQLRSTPISFDRKQVPAVTVNPAVQLPHTYQQRLDNGLQLLGTQSQETPTTALLIRIPVGLYQEDPAHAGVTQLMAAMLQESTQQYSSEQMALALEKLGSSISISSGQRYVEVYVQALSKNLTPTLALLTQKLQHPAFNAADFSRLQQQTLEGIQHSAKDPGYMASRALDTLLFGPHVGSLPAEGTLETVQGLTLEQVKAWYTQQFKPADGQLIVVSSLAQADVTQAISQALAGWTGASKRRDVTLPASQAQAGVVYLVDKPDAPQSEIRLFKRSLPKDILGEQSRLNLMNFALGGNFNSRLNLVLREEKGYTYGASSGFSADPYGGSFVASAAVRADATVAALQDMQQQLKHYAEQGLHAEEVSFMRKAVNQADALRYETPQAKLGYMSGILEYKLPSDYSQQRAELVGSISQEELNQLAKKHLAPAELSGLVVGDAKTLKPQLENAGFKVKEYKF